LSANPPIFPAIVSSLARARDFFLRRYLFHLATFVTQKKVPPVLNGLAAWQRRKEDAQGNTHSPTLSSNSSRISDALS
jgi:hypothetical protein